VVNQVKIMGYFSQTGCDNLSYIVRVVLNMPTCLATEILQALDNAGINNVPSFLLLDKQEINNLYLYLVNAEGIKEKSTCSHTCGIKTLCAFAHNLAKIKGLHICRKLKHSMIEQFMVDQLVATYKEERINKAKPKCVATCPESTVHTLHPMILMPVNTAHSTYAHITCAEGTGGEIESPKCNYGETSNTHTMTGSPKFNHGETDKEQTPHGSAHEIVPVIDYNINHYPSLTTVTSCEVKYSSNDSTGYSHTAMISNDDDTFNKDIEAIVTAKVNVATTELAVDDPVQRTVISEIDCDSTLVDPLGVFSVNKETCKVLEHVIDWFTGVELATNKIADDDPQSLRTMTLYVPLLLVPTR
jgi:hypothetical protein